MDRNVELLAQDLELRDGRRPVGVSSNQQRPLAALAQVEGQLGCRGRLARTLQAYEHDHVGRRPRQIQASRLAQGGDQLLVDDLDHLLGRREALHHLGADTPLADALDKVLDDLKVDVGFQQRQPDLAQGGVNVRLGQLAPVGELAEYAL